MTRAVSGVSSHDHQAMARDGSRNTKALMAQASTPIRPIIIAIRGGTSTSSVAAGASVRRLLTQTANTMNGVVKYRPAQIQNATW